MRRSNIGIRNRGPLVNIPVVWIVTALSLLRTLDSPLRVFHRHRLPFPFYHKQSKALDKLSYVHHRRGFVILSEAFSRWRGQLASRALAVGAFHRLEGLFCRMEMRRAMQRWERAVESRRVALEFAGLVDRTVSRVFLARSWRRW